jgi:hypothetical protein
LLVTNWHEEWEPLIYLLEVLSTVWLSREEAFVRYQFGKPPLLLIGSLNGARHAQLELLAPSHLLRNPLESDV